MLTDPAASNVPSGDQEDREDQAALDAEEALGYLRSLLHERAATAISTSTPVVEGAQMPPLTFSHPQPVDVAKVQPMRAERSPKPLDGLWLTVGSSSDPAPTPWEAFLAAEDMRGGGRDNVRSTVVLHAQARVARLDSAADARALAAECPNDPDFACDGWGSARVIDWDKVACAYDAVWVTASGIADCRRDDFEIGDWAFESVVVTHAGAIERTEHDQGSPMRTTNRAGGYTQGTRLIEGFDDPDLRFDLYADDTALA
ncbi:hypothetical protein ASF47_17895 [Nocardioides sp. Leaf285]|nr:hypothetical protein ASF47_17895 [Nocardioides sp. Leaf285]